MSFHATKLKQENCDLEVIQIPQYQNLCSTVHVYIYSNKIEVLDYFLNYYYFDRESPWIQASQREKKIRQGKQMSHKGMISFGTGHARLVPWAAQS